MKSFIFAVFCLIVVFLCISHADKKVNEIYGLDAPATLQNIFMPISR